MSYFGFLGRFLVPPLIALTLLNVRDARRQCRVPGSLTGQPAWIALLALVVVAVVYTTPWDNYLVATRVWWYDPGRVIGMTFGWVPVEEYAFFILQTLLTGSWWIWLSRHLPSTGPAIAWPALRWYATSAVALLWLGSASILIGKWALGTYLALEFAWAMIPIMLQLAFGADILWHHRRLIALTIVAPTLYLSVADSTAIGAGTWTFSPEKSTGWNIAGALPVEELLFFLLTNTLICFGMTLVMSSESQPRFSSVVRALMTLFSKADLTGSHGPQT